MRRCCPFLWTKHSGCVDEGCCDIARDSKINALETTRRTDGLHRPESSIGCGRPAETNNDSTSAYCDRMEDELSDSSRCCIKRTVCIGTTGNLKPGGEALSPDDDGLPHQILRGVPRPHLREVARQPRARDPSMHHRWRMRPRGQWRCHEICRRQQVLAHRPTYMSTRC